MKKYYSSPYLMIEVFSSQEQIATCEYYFDGVDPLNNANITSSTKFWLDYNQDGLINGTDYYKHSTSQTDGAGWGDKDSIVKAWWAATNSDAEAIYNSSDTTATFAEKQASGLAGYVDAVVNPGNSHYYAGSVTMKKNNS